MKACKLYLHRIEYYARYGIRQWWRWRKWNKYYRLQRELFPDERWSLLFLDEGVKIYIDRKH